jgi:hypothetical protein
MVLTRFGFDHRSAREDREPKSVAFGVTAQIRLEQICAKPRRGQA